tara:strand:+ start:675 stop:983 length:309 start_codon:yes stop_codon:yes gene_type:complete
VDVDTEGSTTEEEEEEFSISGLVLEDVELVSHFKTTSPFLADVYFDMCVELKKELTCGICLDELNCKHCFMILGCGHSFHSSCLMRCVKHECPTCKDCSPYQ